MVENSPNADFAGTVRHLLQARKLSGRKAAIEAGLSHQVVYNMLEGQVPGYRTLRQFADGNQLTDPERNALFAAANYIVAPDARAERPHDPRIVTLTEAARKLRPEQLDVLLSVARSFAGGVRHTAV